MANEKRLIDVNELKRRIIAFATGLHSEVLSVYSIIMMLNQSDTVDAVEVVHGRWIEWYPPMHMILTGEERLYRCSACDAKYPDVEGYRYCPYCGAKMDGDEK